jgi:hypothetical protein
MPRRVHPPRGERVRGEKLPLSVAAGAILVPLTAVVAVVFVAPSESSTSEPPAEEAVAVAAPEFPAPTPTLGRVQPLGADLAAACGPAGGELAAVDSDGSATDVQRAALQALRPICAAVGMPLSEEPATNATTVPPQTTPTPDPVTVDAPVAQDEDGEWEAEYEDGEWEVDD